MLIDPNTSYEEISDEQLVEEFFASKRYKKPQLYALMAKRANNNVEIKKLLFDIIVDRKKRMENAMGVIKHSWLPVLFILEHGNNQVKYDLKKLLENWSLDERDNLLFYIKQDKGYYEFLTT